MLSEKKIQSKIFDIKTQKEFNNIAIDLFHYQYSNNPIYKKYVSFVLKDTELVKHYTQIPFLPIDFFKSQKVVCKDISENTISFSSSGTTGQFTSKHYVKDIEIYETSFQKGFHYFYRNPSEYCILALLPNYLERDGSSLVYMFDKLIKDSKHPMSGFYLNNLDELITTINYLKEQKQKTVLLGVTYALLDLADKNCTLSDHFIVMETGGMKGKRTELVKGELHQILRNKFNVNSIHSEYGMTELLSQAYSKTNGEFSCPPWMKILIRDKNDPFAYLQDQKIGGVNVIDLANIHSCAFIETKDLGKLHSNGNFEILGRFDHSDIRGCNLMIE